MYNDLIVRNRTYHRQKLWWIGKVIIINNKKCFVPYTDIHSPTGYGYKDKAIALKVAEDLQKAIEERSKR